ncbi:MAG: DUF885 domain-containing protein [Deltaproteobacteria bacterium]|nr:DUF885 domain-containing protein [Deltaproteobacteria bacterium]
MAVLIGLLLVVGFTGGICAEAPASGDATFRAAVDHFIESELRMFPERATQLGDHRFDTRVDDLSAHGLAAVVEHATDWKTKLSGFNSKALSPANRADRDWLIARCDGELLETQELRTYQRDPGMYLPTSAVNSLIKRNFAPLENRMESVTERERAALKNFDYAHANLRPERVAPVTIDIDLDQMPATVAFFEKAVPEAFREVPDGPGKSAFQVANRQLVEALEKYGEWLKNDLRPHAAGNYAIGAEAYQRMLADSDMVDIPLDRLETVGVAELGRLQEQFRQTAEELDPKASPAEAAAALAKQHPPADQVIAQVNSGLAALRTYVVEHHIATIPSEVPPIVAETPPFMRATTFASMDSPGPLEKSTEAYFYVTLPDPSWPAEKTDQLLAFYAPPTISDTSVHEVYPGHYVQFLNNRLNPDPVRTIYHSGSNSEGWALYCEQMMLDQGLHRGDPRYRLAQLQMALMRACRYLVGIRMHTRGMSVDEAADFFEKNSYETPHNARVEALRGTDDPGYLRYQLGKLMILKLREDLKKKEGASFDLGRFHNDYLRQGAVPVPLIRRAMLGEEGSLL